MLFCGILLWMTSSLPLGPAGVGQTLAVACPVVIPHPSFVSCWQNPLSIVGTENTRYLLYQPLLQLEYGYKIQPWPRDLRDSLLCALRKVSLNNKYREINEKPSLQHLNVMLSMALRATTSILESIFFAIILLGHINSK